MSALYLIRCATISILPESTKKMYIFTQGINYHVEMYDF